VLGSVLLKRKPLPLVAVSEGLCLRMHGVGIVHRLSPPVRSLIRISAGKVRFNTLRLAAERIQLGSYQQRTSSVPAAYRRQSRGTLRQERTCEQSRMRGSGSRACPGVVYLSLEKGSLSIKDAMEVGRLVEINDIEDLDRILQGNPPDDYRVVLENLRSGSEYHLAAFNRQLGL